MSEHAQLHNAQRTASRSMWWTALVATLLVGVLAVPATTLLLPNTESAHPEVYQPLKTLKFFKNRGQAYHKYGPMMNFVLAPGYGASLGWWYLNDDFDNPSEDFPYGLKRPLEQLNFLIVQSRVLLLLLALAAFCWFTLQLRWIAQGQATDPPDHRPWLLPLAAGLILIAVTNPFVAWRLPVARPDTLLFTLMSVCLGFYVRMIFLGVTRRRLVLTGCFLMMAVSAKEIAATIFLLPCFGIAWLLIRDVRRGALDFKRALNWVLVSLAVSVAVYAVINIIYAPEVWVERIRFWLFGWNPSEVWDSGLSNNDVTGGYVIRQLFGELLSHLGIGGALTSTIGLALVFVLRPRHWLLLLLPLLSWLLFGLVPMGYVPSDQYFILLPAMLLLPVTGALVLAWRRVSGALRTLVITGVVLLAVADGVHATFAWHGVQLRFNATLDRYIREELPEGSRFGMLSRTPFEPGRVVYDGRGYEFDRRNVTGLMDAAESDPASLPPVLLVQRGLEQWLLDARKWRARARLLAEEDGVNVDRFKGVAALGYRLEKEVVGQMPAWYPFSWMRRMQWLQDRRALRVYRRTGT